MRRINRRPPVDKWRDPSTGEVLDVHIPGMPVRQGEDEERRLIDEVERKREADPEVRLKRFQERKEWEEKERKRRASPGFRAQEVEPRRERMREIEEQYEQIVRSVFGRLGALEGSGNVDTSIPVDELMEKAQALAAEYIEVKTELYRVQGGLVPQPMPGIPAKRLGCDLTVQALQWINLLALGWHRYSGTRKVPPIYVAPPRARR